MLNVLPAIGTCVFPPADPQVDAVPMEYMSAVQGLPQIHKGYFV